MNNSSSRTGLVLVAAIALLGMVWLASGRDDDLGEVDVVDTAALDAGPVSFTPMTPQDRVKQRNLESVQRKIAEAKKVGEVTDGGLIKMTNDDGTSYFISPKLVEGVGRNGEPLYAFVQLAKTAPGPLKRSVGNPARMKTPERKNVISRFGSRGGGGTEDAGPGAGTGAGTGTGGGSGTGDGGASGGAPGGGGGATGGGGGTTGGGSDGGG